MLICELNIFQLRTFAFCPHYFTEVNLTDGKINATLPKTTPMDDITLDIAIELIANKKAKGLKKRRFKKK